MMKALIAEIKAGKRGSRVHHRRKALLSFILLLLSMFFFKEIASAQAAQAVEHPAEIAAKAQIA